MSAVGIVLAAGAGSRYGRPKATVVEDGRSWLNRAVEALADGGCDDVVVVLGAEADEARTLLDGSVRVVVAENWSTGLSASLRRGLEELAYEPAAVDRAVVSLVDLPDVHAAVVQRLLAGGAGPETLARAVYDGCPGHPVVLGRAHWDAVRADVAGDRGAGPYLEASGVSQVECGDLATGRDVDTAVRLPGEGRPAQDLGSPGGVPSRERLL